MSTEVRLVHLADLHLGFTGPATLVFKEGEPRAGRYVREVDVEEATKHLIQRISRLQPPADVVLLAGDLFHRPAPLPRAIYLAAQAIHALTRRGIEVVLIDGNHERSAGRLHAGSPLDYLRELEAHVVNGPHYEVIGVGEKGWRSDRLKDQLAVHALPYQALLQGEFAGVAPLPGRLNVLVAHGRVGGAPSMPEANTLGLRVAEIPSEVLRRGWDYVALGDWHVHGFRPLGDAPAYYAGTPEALTFGDAADYPLRPGDPRAIGGALDVRLAPGHAVEVSTIRNEGRRPALKLRPIDAAGLSADALLEQVRTRLTADLPAEAIVRLEVQHCPRATWETVDQAELAQLRDRVRRCEIVWDLVEPESASHELTTLTVEEQWEGFLAAQIPDAAERDALVRLGRERIEAARQQMQQQRVAAGQADEQ